MISTIFGLVVNFISNIKWTPLKISIGINIIMACILIFLLDKPIQQDPVYVVEEKMLVIPQKDGAFELLTPSTPVIHKSPTINKKLLADYRSLRDSIAKEKAYEEAITENEYRETYEDSIVKIDVYTKVRGKLLKQAPSYIVKPTTVKHIDTTSVNLYEPTINFYGGVEAGFPIGVGETTAKGTLYFQNKKQNIISLGIDTKGHIWGGYIIKL